MSEKVKCPHCLGSPLGVVLPNCHVCHGIGFVPPPDEEILSDKEINKVYTSLYDNKNKTFKLSEYGMKFARAIMQAQAVLSASHYEARIRELEEKLQEAVSQVHHNADTGLKLEAKLKEAEARIRELEEEIENHKARNVDLKEDRALLYKKLEQAEQETARKMIEEFEEWLNDIQITNPVWQDFKSKYGVSK